MLVEIIFAGIASGVLALTITKSTLFSKFRSFFKEDSFLGELFSCLYCMSHWTSLLFLFLGGVTFSFVNWFVIVFIALVAAGIILKLI